jgi:DNA helicase-2/ATP-dependent DNA helicase PcrA
MSSVSPLLDSLNLQQRQAIQAIFGPVLVLAGAGTGKTRVLTTRLAHILSEGYAYPSQVLAVTFTNKAANEMKERVSQLLGRPTEGFWLGTFHALAVRILRRYGELIGLRSDFTILDSDDQIRLLKQILQAHQIDDKKHPAKMVSIIINRWKDRGLPPQKVSTSEQAGNTLIVQIYQEYQQRLLTLNAVDFGDLLMHNLTIFANHPEVLHHYQDQFKFILVDEYQDTNIAQYIWLRLLAQGHGNICCVGDDDQSIYAWRGAEVGNILRFEQDFPGAVVIRLEQNYRSTPHILGAASGLIQHNTGRLGKTLWTESDVGDKVNIRGAWDSEGEARLIADDIEAWQRHGESLSSMAILVRAGFQTREFEDRFLVLGIPYRVIGGLRFYERQEIRDALAYLRLLQQVDDGLAFERIINVPRRGIGTATLQIIHTYAREHGLSLSRAAIFLSESDEIKGAARTSLRHFFLDLDRWRKLLETESHIHVAQTVLEESGYTDMWRQDKSAEAPGRLENLKELLSAMEEFASLQEFLEHVSLVMENTQKSNEDMISLMTLHAAKGLEFDSVYLAGWEEGIFPHQRSLDESGVEGLEEERRLAYVGLTRARLRVMITYALNRRTYQGWQVSRPSRFISELPDEHVHHIQPGGRQTNYNAQSIYHKPTYQKSMSYSRTGQIIDLDYEEEPIHDIEKNDRVFHQKFGYGRVVFVDGDQLHIHFDNSGLKKIMVNFVEKV